VKILILGGGGVGSRIAEQLIAENHDVVIIERDPSQAAVLSHRLDCMVLNDSGNSREVLRRGGAAKADVFIAVTDSDEVNMITCGLVASEFKIPLKVARVRNTEYTQTHLSHTGFFGVDFLVNPEVEAASEIVTSVEHGALSDVIVFDNSDLQIRSTTVSAGSPICGRPLGEAMRGFDAPFLVAAVLRGSDYLIPSGTTILRENDLVYVIGTQANLDRFFSVMGKPRRPMNKIVIVGGGKIGSMICGNLLEDDSEAKGVVSRVFRKLVRRRGRQVVVVDRDVERCKELSRRYPRALVIHADISDEGVFEEEQLVNADLIICTTHNQELNIVSALYARTLGIERSIVLVGNASYGVVCSRLLIDVTVSLRQAVVNAVLRVIRQGLILSVHSLFHGKIEVLEFEVAEGSAADGHPIRDIRFPRDSLLVSISRDGTANIAHGNSVVQSGDSVVVIGKSEDFQQIRSVFTR